MARLIALLAAVVLMFACAKRPEAPQEYPVTGQVIRLDAQSRLATIKHENIPGWMEAMTMQFPVKEDVDWQALTPGARIRATVYHRKSDNEYWIAHVQRAE